MSEAKEKIDVIKKAVSTFGPERLVSITVKDVRVLIEAAEAGLSAPKVPAVKPEEKK